MARTTDANIDLDLVARFVRVAEARSFAAAAARTGLPKSTLSRSVSRLEMALGIRLLERTTRAVRLTDEGMRLFETASRGLTTIDEALDHAVDSPLELRGTLRISAPPDIGDMLLADLLASFAERHPEVRIEAELSNRFVDLVKDGFDAAMRAGTLRDSSLVARKLTDTPFALYASPGYLRAHGTPKKPAELETHPFVLFRPTHGEQRISLRSSKGTVRIAARGPIACDDLAFARRCCLRGAGIASLPRFSADPDAASGRLVEVLPGHESGNGTLHLVYPSSRLAPARLVAFRDFSVEFFRARKA